MSIKLCIFGGRDLLPSNDAIEIELYKFLLVKHPTHFGPSLADISEVVCGMTAGADAMGRVWGMGNKIKITPFYANWSKYGNEAGPIRNAAMADYCTHGLGFWDGKSRGTANMCAQLTLRRKPCWLSEMKPDEVKLVGD